MGMSDAVGWGACAAVGRAGAGLARQQDVVNSIPL